MTITRFRASALAVLLSLSLVAAACGADDSATPSADATTDDATDDTAAGGGDSAASDDPYLQLCPPEEAPDRLVLSIWNGHIDTLTEAYAPFTELTGVEVEFLGNGTGDRITRLNVESGSPTIDMAVVPINEVGLLLDNGVVMETDTSIPNYENLYPAAQLEGGYGTSILQVAVGYNPEFVDPPETWTDIFTDPQYAGAISLVQIPDASGYGTLAMLAREMGGDETDLTPAIDLIAEASDDILVFTNAGSEAEAQVSTGDVHIYPALAGTIVRYREEGGPVEITIPGEGGPAGLNVAVIPVGVEHEGCAKALVSWMLEPDVQLAYATAQYFGPAVDDVEIPDDLTDVLYPIDPDSVISLDWGAITTDAAENLDYWSRTVIG
ncbi:MAG: ABC transporter substrate-binding protein [Acidimicrobiales bacterium]